MRLDWGDTEIKKVIALSLAVMIVGIIMLIIPYASDSSPPKRDIKAEYLAISVKAKSAFYCFEIREAQKKAIRYDARGPILVESGSGTIHFIDPKGKTVILTRNQCSFRSSGENVVFVPNIGEVLWRRS